MDYENEHELDIQQKPGYKHVRVRDVTQDPKLFVGCLYCIRVSYIFLVSPHIQICTKYNIKLSVSYQFHCVSASVSPLYLDSASSH